eukprot:6502729-Alexandrium_andersonii.AAC.1
MGNAIPAQAPLLGPAHARERPQEPLGRPGGRILARALAGPCLCCLGSQQGSTRPLRTRVPVMEDRVPGLQPALR